MNSKKYLDQDGVKFLWSKISMEDYPNNETLIAVLNAIDETKADKEQLLPKTNEPHYQLITDANGNPVWIERDFYALVGATIIPKATYGVFSSYGMTINGNFTIPKIGETYHVIYGDIETDKIAVAGNRGPRIGEDYSEFIIEFENETQIYIESAKTGQIVIEITQQSVKKINATFLPDLPIATADTYGVVKTTDLVGKMTDSTGAEIFNDYLSNRATGIYSHAEGYKTSALSDYSHAEGYSTKAVGESSHAEGFLSEATGKRSHAEGYNTVASGIDAHAEGVISLAEGAGSHAEGFSTEATGNYSHAEGMNTKAASTEQHVQGRYNIADENEIYAHIVGNGASEAHSNAHTLDWNGNAWFAGDVYVGSASGTNKDEGSKKLITEEVVDTKIANLVNSAPETLDTLGELATALQDNADIAEVLNEAIGNKADKTDVEVLFNKLNSNLALSFYCVEDVTVITNGTSKIYPANSNVEIKFADTDVFEIIPTSDYSILSLNAYPRALGTYYSWLEGVKQFSNILFDMNNVDFYSKWSQGNQGAYQVQYAQYINCIFWSDNPYVSDVSKRTNYTLYYTSQLPLCYSSIPDNTFKSFYLAFNVNSDPNWGNKAYRDSFAKATWATQVFSYYGARTIGIFGHDDPDFNITLPKDCRGLMYQSTAIENAGTFDAVNTTNFGAKSGSWRDAFGQCSSLKNLYIKNLKVNLNISWSPINYQSISFIISNAANTNAITISVSPYTYNLLSPTDFALAESKNITIELLTTNYREDNRFSTVAYKTGDGEFAGDVVAGNGSSTPVSLKSLNNLVQNKANSDSVLLKTQQTLTEEELTQVHNNLKIAGRNVAGKEYTINDATVIAASGAEVFNYSNNIASGAYSHAEGSGTTASGPISHAEGGSTTASGTYSHAEGRSTNASGEASHAEGGNYTTASGQYSHAEGNHSVASGEASHAEGSSTATCYCSHAEGFLTTANSSYQHVQGFNNIIDQNNQYAHIVGNGTHTNPSNAHTIDWDGLGWFAGGLKIGGTGQNDTNSKEVAIKEEIPTKISQLENDSKFITEEQLENHTPTLQDLNIIYSETEPTVIEGGIWLQPIS